MEKKELMETRENAGMGIMESIEKRICLALDEFKGSMVSAIMEMCKGTGIDSNNAVHFTQALTLFVMKAEKRADGSSFFTTETILADSIVWDEDLSYFLLEFNGKYAKSSDWLSPDALCIVYEEMCNVLKKL